MVFHFNHNLLQKQNSKLYNAKKNIIDEDKHSEALCIILAKIVGT